MIKRTFDNRLLHSQGQADHTLAASITKAASKQTYYTILLLVDRDLVPNAFRTYAYFRWLDDRLDQSGMERPERVAIVERQVAIMDRCYRGGRPSDLTVEEDMLADLIQSDPSKTSGLYSYIRNMMAVMAFDADRRGRLITQLELANYTQYLANAVTEALHYFIGHCCYSPRNDLRYLAVTAAHITHMLRDTSEDHAAGYFNIPKEYLEAKGITAQEIESDPYRAWVHSRVLLARKCFQAGKAYMMQVQNLRCRIAGYAYTARFERVLEAIERDEYQLRSDYPEHNTVATGLRMVWSTLSMALKRRQAQPVSRALPVR